MTVNSRISIGLLPFYLKLYDDLGTERRAGFKDYLERIAAAFEARGIAVHAAPICRLAGEFEQAVGEFERLEVDAVVTLHLAYSPSLEALETFCRTRLPIVILDAAMDADFGCGVAASRIMYNHGVHGVMDFASMLRRRRRHYEIVAGHDGDGRVMDRAADRVRAAVGVAAMRNSRMLRVGDTFAGMGDFDVPADVLKARFGIKVKQIGLETLDESVRQVTDQQVAAEISDDRERFVCDLKEENHTDSVRVGLGLRRVVEAGGYGGLSVNFQAFNSSDRPSDTMPFLEISKAMARGIGYGGEGDVLTAALVGALTRAFGAVTFTEIFCADWKGNALFLTHMGEISPAVAADKPRVLTKPFILGGSKDPAVLTCAVKPGPAVFVNLAPGPDDSFALIVAPVEVLAENSNMDPKMRDSVRAWIRPRCPVVDFLEKYSLAGGTHHSALVLGDRAEAIPAFGRGLGIHVLTIG